VVVGVLMWNVFNKVSVARKIIREHRHYDDLAEVAKLFRIHDKLVSVL
jgi:programmed cell death 8 (apoptosis-inducing factor)